MKTKSQECPQNLSIRDLARMAQVLKLLAHRHRLKIIDLLETYGSLPVNQLTEKLELPQAATSGHLARMRRIGLVEAKRRGKEVWYELGDRRSLTILNCMRNRQGAAS